MACSYKRERSQVITKRWRHHFCWSRDDTHSSRKSGLPLCWWDPRPSTTSKGCQKNGDTKSCTIMQIMCPFVPKNLCAIVRTGTKMWCTPEESERITKMELQREQSARSLPGPILWCCIKYYISPANPDLIYGPSP
jgi:hypothetical protein